MFDEIIADMEPQSYFKKSKTIRKSTTHCFILKIPYKNELQQINHLIIHQTFISFMKIILKNHIYFSE